jgi:ATP-dependent DNA helicase RecQ
MEAMINFVTSTHRCRMQLVQDYFNETTFQTCGICDVCIEKRKKENFHIYDELKEEIISILKRQSTTVEKLEELIAPKDHELFVDVVRDLVDESVLEYDKVWKLKLVKN